MKRQELDQVVLRHFNEEELDRLFEVRGYRLLEKGERVLSANTDIINRHPKKY